MSRNAAFETTTKSGLTVSVHYDDGRESPRDEYDNVGTMACAHRRYSLGDEKLDPDTFERDLAEEVGGTALVDVLDYLNEEWFTKSREKFRAIVLDDLEAEYQSDLATFEDQKRQQAVNQIMHLSVPLMYVAEAAKNAERPEDVTGSLLQGLLPEYRVSEEEKAALLGSTRRRLLDDADEKSIAEIERMEKAFIQRELNRKVVMLPLYLYDHGGLTMKTSSFSCRWDSGQVGVIYVTADTIVRERSADSVDERGHITTDARAWAIARLRSEVEVYDAFFRGAVYGFDIESEDGEHVDSCWGFYNQASILEAINESLPEDEALEEINVLWVVE